MRSADDAEEELFQRQLFAGGGSAIARSGWRLGLDSGAQFFERALGY